MVYVYIAFILLFLFIILLFTPVIIRGNINNNDISIKLILLGVIKIKIKEKTTFEKLKDSNKKKRRIPFKKLIEITGDSLPSVRYLAKRLRVKVNLDVNIGLSAADKTALSVGIINMLLYSLEGFLRNYLGYYFGKYSINPDFTGERFVFYILAEARVIPLHIIAFSIKLLKVFLKHKKYFLRKGGASNAGSSNRRINENYNG